MENDFNYGGQTDNGFDPNANAGGDPNVQQAMGGEAYGTADNNAFADQSAQGGFDSFGNPVQNGTDGFNAPQEQKSTLAIVSLVCGIVGIVLGCCCCLGPVAGVAAIITGVMNIKKQAPGKGMAMAGIIMGAISVVLYLIIFIVNMVTGASTALLDSFNY